MAEYKVAMYIRLSDSDEEMGKKKDESNSVVHQRMLISNYLDNNKEFEACLKEEFVDDGFSGTNMIRPAFQRMLKAVKEGIYNMIIVKDLSRFSRDYIETGNYLECVFPFVGVRFVSINDGLKRFSYTGALVTNKKSEPSVGSHKFRLQDKSKWIVVNNQYEPIISEEEYEKAQRIFRKMKKSEKSPKDFPLRSLVRCGYCGRVMSRRAKGRGFFCFYHSD